MSEIKLTKQSLRSEQLKLAQLEHYLPTLQLKKSLLQSEVGEARQEILRLTELFDNARLQLSAVGSLFSQSIGFPFESLAKVSHINKEYENIAGVDVPIFKDVQFDSFAYSLFTTPAWIDSATRLVRQLVEAKVRISVAEEKLAALENELREVTIRVNLFEKNLIPKALANIRKIKVFLGDQELAAVGQAKVAKKKIQERKEAHRAY
jgi:V/A-type H+-transporting ATPase subunit D